MSLKPIEDLKRLYSAFDPKKETIVYCQSGARATETAGLLQHLGFTNVKVYDSSWLGYGNTLDAPANNVTFFNVGLLNSRLSATSRPLILRREVASNFFMIIFLSVHAALHVCICCHASRMRHHITAITDITDRFVCGRGRASGVASAPETVELLRPPETSWSHECCIAPASALPRPEWVLAV
jgi:hypothetical protein